MRTLKRIRGMSLVELMVGMAVGLIGITIITHLYVTNEKYKRSTTGAGQAQVNGAIALYTLERDLRMAGAGLNHSGGLGCTCDTGANPNCSPLQYVRNGVFSTPPGAGGVPPLRFAPVVITETANQPDTITVLYGTSPHRNLPQLLSSAQGGPAGAFVLDGTSGFWMNDMIVVANGATCRMAQLSEAATATDLRHSTGIWNGGAPFPAMANASLVFNLGANPAWRIYSVANGRLRASEVLTNHVTGGTPTEIMDDIVDLQAQYGKDTDATPGVDTWNTGVPVDAAGWQQVLAVRVAVLARSQNYERPDPATGQCNSTIWDANRPQWGEGQDFPVLAAAATGLQNAASQLRCYKYRVFETIIPLRNMIWRPA